jgi:uncharacterized peroxidase-related enzyme
MFLKEIETKPAAGMTKIAFDTLRNSGETIPEILHLFRYKTRSTTHLVRFTDEVMRGPSPLSPGLRELIGAYFSKKNRCAFCSDAHAAAATEYLEKGLVDEVLQDLENSRLDAAHKALFRYVGKLAEHPERVTDSDIARLKEAGWSDEAIYDTLTVASVFRFYNTWNNGSGVQNMKPADYAYSGKVLRHLGYCMDFKLVRLFRIIGRHLLRMFQGLFAINRQRNTGTRGLWMKPNPDRAPST